MAIYVDLLYTYIIKMRERLGIDFLVNEGGFTR